MDNLIIAIVILASFGIGFYLGKFFDNPVEWKSGYNVGREDGKFKGIKRGIKLMKKDIRKMSTKEIQAYHAKLQSKKKTYKQRKK